MKIKNYKDYQQLIHKTMTTTTLKTIWIGTLSIIPAGLLIWTDGMFVAIVVLLLAFLLDTTTGIIKAFWCGTFKTSIAWNKIPKKLVRLTIAISACYILEVIGVNGDIPFSLLEGVFCWALMWLAVIEILSVFENLDDMGLQVPTSFIKHIRRNILKEECDHKEKK